MKVKMLTIDVTPGGNFYPGCIRTVSEAEGKELIDAKAALEYKEAPKAENKLAPAAGNKSGVAEAEKLVSELEKNAAEAEAAVKSLPKGASKEEKQEAYKVAKATRQAAKEAAEKLAELKK